MGLSRPGALIIHTTSKKVLILRVENNPALAYWHPQTPTQQPARPSFALPRHPSLPPSLSWALVQWSIYFSSCLTWVILSRHLAASAVIQGFLLRRQRMLLPATVKEKNSLHFSLFSLQKKYWTNKTCIPGPEMLQRAHVCWDWMWNVEQCWLLSFAFQPEQAHKSTAEIWADL